MGACGGKELGVDIDLENVPPNASEEKTYAVVNEVLERRSRIIKLIEDYKGCQELARAAMSTPSHETEKAAFEGLLVAVDSIAEFFSYSKQLEKVFPVLVKQLAESVKGDVCALNEQPALTKQLADLFDFALDFDRIRMLRPNLSNDFSYYRRLLPKFNKHPGIKVKDDEASGMALFTAEHIPMTSCLAKSGQKAQEANENVSNVLATMANSCFFMIKKKLAKPASMLFLARAMTGAVVIFDHIDNQGVFHRKTPVATKQIIMCLKREFPNELSLLNAIRYSTKTFRDAPDTIQQLFE